MSGLALATRPGEKQLVTARGESSRDHQGSKIKLLSINKLYPAGKSGPTLGGGQRVLVYHLRWVSGTSPAQLGRTLPNRPHPLKQSAWEVAERMPDAPGEPLGKGNSLQTGLQYSNIEQGETILLFLASVSPWMSADCPGDLPLVPC